MIDKMYSKKEVAEKLGFTTRTIENMMKSGVLKYVKIANRIRFKESDIIRLIDGKQAQGGEE